MNEPTNESRLTPPTSEDAFTLKITRPDGEAVHRQQIQTAGKAATNGC